MSAAQHALQQPHCSTRMMRVRAFSGARPRGPAVPSATAAPAAAAPMAPAQQKSTGVVLPPSLRNSVAVLEAPNASAPGGKTQVYLLGMSHVSKKSVEQVRELVQLVRPEVVMVELCRERLGLLVDPQDASKPPTVWHSRKTQVQGLPDSPDWPKDDELKPLLVCRPGRPVSVRDIESDAVTLLSTGLFKSVRPACDNAGRNEAPEFSVTLGGDGKPRVVLVPPLGAIRFVTEERSLPGINAMSARLDSSLKAAGVDQAALDAVCRQAVEESRKAAAAATAAAAASADKGKDDAAKPASSSSSSSVTLYLRTRRRFAELFPGQQIAVSFSGVDVGRVEATVKARKASDRAFVSGLEGSAPGGEGFGIETFRPMRNMFQISEKMFIPQDAIDEVKAQLRAQAAAALAAEAGTAAVSADAVASNGHGASSNGNGASTSGSGADVAAAGPRVKAPLRPWSAEEAAAAKIEEPPEQPVADLLAALLNSTYARIQSKAGRTLGVEPGEAWRAALEAATEAGSGAVLLADRPIAVTQRRMADDMLGPAGGRLAAALAVVTAALVGTLSTTALPQTTEAGVFVAALAAAAAVAWPVVAPLLEISKFAEMSGPEIEEAVAIQAPIDQGDLSRPLRLFGEDALLDWPGAMQGLIHERDLFMSKAIAAVATGRGGVAPAFVADEVDGQRVWRYAMPEGAPLRAAPQGFGDGALLPMQGVRAVVGVVGSAHVHGMVREWPACVRDPSVDVLLLDAPPAPAGQA